MKHGLKNKKLINPGILSIEMRRLDLSFPCSIRVSSVAKKPREWSCLLNEADLKREMSEVNNKNIMNTFTPYVPSKLLTGDIELLRQHTFTRWLSRDLMQATVDFCRNIELLPAYSETSPDHLTRYLFWRLPQGAITEVRSGRARDKFEEFDRVNRERNLRLLSLHINESDIYSAVWISAEHFETAKAILLAHGITAAEKKTS